MLLALWEFSDLIELTNIAVKPYESVDGDADRPCEEAWNWDTQDHQQVSPLVAYLLIVLEQSELALDLHAVDWLGYDGDNRGIEQEKDYDSRCSGFVIPLLSVDPRTSSVSAPEENTDQVNDKRHAGKHDEPNVVQPESTFPTSTKAHIQE